MNHNVIRNSIVCLIVLLVPAAALASADVTPPAVVSFAFAPGAVDVTSTSQTISVTAEATDDSSGVEDVDCEFRSPSGNNYVSVYMDNYDSLVSGNPLDGVYCGTQTLGTCSEPGTWTLFAIRVDDECGNATTYEATASGSVLAYPPGTQTTLVVTNTNVLPSAAPRPVITSFTYAPMSVTLSPTNAVVTGTATITGSNISSGSFEFISPSGSQDAYGSFSFPGNMTAGTTGTATATFSFGICDGPGTWKLDYIYATSPTYESCESTSSTEYTTTNLPAGTPASTIVVTNTDTSLTPPAIVSLLLSSTTVDVTNGDASITGSGGATDSLSGIEEVYGTYSGTSGNTLEIGLYDGGGAGVLSGTLSGSIYATTCTPPGVYTLKSLTVEDECGNEGQYGGVHTAFPPGVTGTSFLVINGTIPTGSLAVNILPEQAVYNGASWYLDGTNDYYYSGEVVTGLSPGQHTIYYNTASGYVTSGSQTLMIAANQNAYATGTYVSSAPSDSVQTNLLPPLVTGSALWNVDYGPLQPSGTIVSTLADGTTLTDGTHVVEFSDINGYIAPVSQMVTTAGNQTTVTSGTYVEVTGSGSLTVTLAPAGAIKAGATWNVDDGPSHNSGDVVGGLIAIQHTVNFLGGGTAYAPPASQDVVINANALTSATGTYTPLATGTGSLTVTISPPNIGAEWYVDSNSASLHKSGTTVAGISGGNHTVNFTTVSGYITPASQSVTIFPDETVGAIGSYSKAPPFVGAAAMFAGISPSGNGLLTLKLKDNGKFSGKLVTANGATYTLSGSLSATGYFSGQTGHPPVPYTIQVTGSTPGTYVLTGSANGKGVTAYPGSTVAETGMYTALLAATGTDADIPQGTGYATLKVNGAGVGKITGKLADGTSFSSSDVVVAGAAGNELIVFDPHIYNQKGLVSGVLVFGVPAAAELSGTLSWQKPAISGHYYDGGIDTTLSVAGALYNKDAGVPFTTGTVTFTGMPDISLAQPFTDVSSSGVVTTGTSAVKVTIKLSTGAVSGSFKPAPGEPAISFKGMLLQDPGNAGNTIGAGYFLSPVVSGTGYSGNVTLP